MWIRARRAYRREPWAWRVTLFALLGLVLIAIQVPAAVHADIPQTMLNAATVNYAANGGEYLTLGGSSSSSATLVVSFPASAPVGVAATAAVNLALVNGSTVTNATGQTLMSGVVPVGGVRSITLGDGATNAPTDYVGAVGGYAYGFGGTTWDRLRTFTAGGTVTSTTAGTLGVIPLLNDSSTHRNITSARNTPDGTNGNSSLSGTVLLSDAGATSFNHQRASTVGTGIAQVSLDHSFVNITTAATSQVKATTGILHTVTINSKSVGGTLKLFDQTTGSCTTTPIATIDTTLSTTAFIYDLKFANGLCANNSGGTPADITVTYR